MDGGPHPNSQDEDLHAGVRRFEATLMQSRDGTFQLRFKCDHCKSWHTHGGPCGGHRAAHCHRRNSPYRETGYWLDVKPGEATSW
jgi:hypothetical protein